MTFSEALSEMKKGAKITRKGDTVYFYILEDKIMNSNTSEIGIKDSDYLLADDWEIYKPDAKPKLKPNRCGCGGKAIIVGAQHKAAYSAYIRCDSCGIRSETFYDASTQHAMERATARWNKAHPATRITNFEKIIVPKLDTFLGSCSLIKECLGVVSCGGTCGVCRAEFAEWLRKEYTGTKRETTGF